MRIVVRDVETEIAPYGGRVILESFPDDLRGAPLLTKSKIIIPGRYAETSRLATVVAISKGSDLVVNEIVLCSRYPQSAWAVNWNGRELVSVKEDEILAKIEVNDGAQ